MVWLLLCTFLWWSTPALAQFRCAGFQVWAATPKGVAAKLADTAQSRTTGTRRALVLFARFKGEDTTLPSWAADLFNPDLPGSFSHFYDTMSFGKLQVWGEVAPRVYESAQPASAYLADGQVQGEEFGQFSLDILRQADQDIDFAQFDNDGPDGIPNSGDDDGVVDAVFLVLARVPTNFLQGEATGISRLGFADPFHTADAGAGGKAARILPEQGTIQQGRFFAEAVGSMCHEYGHVLGLPDLYDTEFFQQEGAGPEEDSAGVGAWCLMGWGATGWNGNDGPNSFCAWSRMQLGWVEVEQLAQEHQEIRLEPVGSSNQVFKVPLNNVEYFLLENRQRAGLYYDHHLPGEGLLIWHVHQLGMDLECADGRWQDAGYPTGRAPDARGGADNLDFWAHDARYTQEHGGNLGDATDPFDGVRFTAFTPESNPSSHSQDGRLSVRVEGIHFEGDIAVAQVQARPLLASVTHLKLQGDYGDQVFMVGEPVAVECTVFNEGHTPLQEVEVRLHTDDPLVHIEQEKAPLGELLPGEIRQAALNSLRLRFIGEFRGAHTALLMLDIFAGEILVGEYPFEVRGFSPRQTVSRIGVLDSLGNGDGQAQGGEIIRLKMDLEEVSEQVLKALHFALRPLNSEVKLIGIAEMKPDTMGILRSAEFLLSAGRPPGTRLDFEFQVSSRYSTWADTLSIALEPGPDQTPPRVLALGLRAGREGIRLVLAESQVLDGSGLAEVHAVVYSREDTAQVAVVPLQLRGHQYEGNWLGNEEGQYLVAVVATDSAGNMGRSQWQQFELVEREGGGVGAISNHWEALPFPDGEHLLSSYVLSLASGDPALRYLSTSQGAWRSAGSEGLWEGITMTFGVVLVDPLDPQTIYTVGDHPLKSRDGGRSWAPAFADLAVELRAVDPVDPQRLYGRRGGQLVISADRGASWRETGIGEEGNILAHSRVSQVLYFKASETFDSVNFRVTPGPLYRSADGGQTWERRVLGRLFTYYMVPDPQDLKGLYATNRDTLWHSRDGGREWEQVRIFETAGTDPYMRLAISLDGMLYLWNTGSKVLRRSSDGGKTWHEQSLPDAAGQLVLDRRNPAHFFLISKANALFETQDGGLNWENIPLPQIRPPAGTLVFDQAGKLTASMARQTARGQVAGLYTSESGGMSWEQLGGEIRQASGPIEVLYTDPYGLRFLLARMGGGFYGSTDRGASWLEMSTDERNFGSPSAYPEILAPPQHPEVCYLAGLGVSRVSDQYQWSYAQTRSTGLPQQVSVFGYSYTAEVSGLVIDPEYPATLCAAIGDSLWRTQDEGLHWEYFNQMGEGGAIYALHRHPLDAHKIYAATEGGIYLSEDEGKTWILLAHPEIKWPRKMRLRFDAHDPRRLLWVTGTQLFESEDGGHTWYSLGEGLTGLPWFSDAAFDPLDPAVIYAATAWGVYRLDTYQSGTAVEATQSLPATFSLSPNYPNPFNPTTTLRFSLPHPGEAELSIYNLLGQRVATLVRGVQEAGTHALVWDGRDEQGRELASGVYFYRLQAGAQVETRKLLLLR